VAQTGSNNNMTLAQYGDATGGNKIGSSGAPVAQSDSYETAFLGQGATYAGGVLTGYAYVDGNTIAGSQAGGVAGGGNTVVVTQNSNGNTASYVQNGQSNSATIKQ